MDRWCRVGEEKDSQKFHFHSFLAFLKNQPKVLQLACQAGCKFGYRKKYPKNHGLIGAGGGRKRKTKNAQILYSQKRRDGPASLNPSGITAS